MGNKTPLFHQHQSMGGKIVDFSGWDMPLHYGSQIREHQSVRDHCAMFDVSHMTVVDLLGARSRDFLRYLLANDVGRILPGKAIYSVMLDQRGGILDDIIVYQRGEQSFRIVANCATGEEDIRWMRTHSKGFDVDIKPRPDLAIIAVQGPNALVKVSEVVCDEAAAALCELPTFGCVEVGQWLLARTGYTGEDGVEIILPAQGAEDLWSRLAAAGVPPAGLAARDTLRLEAGFNLYGSDMDATVSPLESNLGWTIAWQPEGRDFLGRRALEALRETGVERRLVGLMMKERGVLRAHQKISFPDRDDEGEITSGTFSPTLGCAIALARVPAGVGEEAAVEIRGRQVPVTIVRPCFVRHGRSQVS